MCRCNSPLFRPVIHQHCSIGHKIQHFYTFIVLVNQQGIQFNTQVLSVTWSTLYQFIGRFNAISNLLYVHVCSVIVVLEMENHTFYVINS